jgi:hypothetical protein
MHCYAPVILAEIRVFVNLIRHNSITLSIQAVPEVFHHWAIKYKEQTMSILYYRLVKGLTQSMAVNVLPLNAFRINV